LTKDKESSSASKKNKNTRKHQTSKPQKKIKAVTKTAKEEKGTSVYNKN
jgi:hypothetical protein